MRSPHGIDQSPFGFRAPMPSEPTGGMVTASNNVHGPTPSVTPETDWTTFRKYPTADTATPFPSATTSTHSIPSTTTTTTSSSRATSLAPSESLENHAPPAGTNKLYCQWPYAEGCKKWAQTERGNSKYCHPHGRMMGLKTKKKKQIRKAGSKNKVCGGVACKRTTTVRRVYCGTCAFVCDDCKRRTKNENCVCDECANQVVQALLSE